MFDVFSVFFFFFLRPFTTQQNHRFCLKGFLFQIFQPLRSSPQVSLNDIFRENKKSESPTCESR